MKFLFTAAAILFSISYTNAQKIMGMWTYKEGDKIKVLSISDKDIETSETDLTFTAFATQEKLTIKKNTPTADLKGGRIIIENLEKKIRIIDYTVMSEDSLLVNEGAELFDSPESAEKASKSKEKPKTFYSNEFLFRQAVIKKMPPVTKDQYLAFLRDVSKELKKPDALKKSPPDPSKPGDVQMIEFMDKMVSRKEYQGKIIPETLKIAREKYKDDAGVKKIIPTIRVSFAKKPAATGVSTTTPPAPTTTAPAKK